LRQFSRRDQTRQKSRFSGSSRSTTDGTARQRDCGGRPGGEGESNQEGIPGSPRCKSISLPEPRSRQHFPFPPRKSLSLLSERNLCLSTKHCKSQWNPLWAKPTAEEPTPSFEGRSPTHSRIREGCSSETALKGRGFYGLTEQTGGLHSGVPVSRFDTLGIASGPPSATRVLNAAPRPQSTVPSSTNQGLHPFSARKRNVPRWLSRAGRSTLEAPGLIRRRQRVHTSPAERTWNRQCRGGPQKRFRFFLFLAQLG